MYMQCNLENIDAEFYHFARFVVTYKENLMTLHLHLC